MLDGDRLQELTRELDDSSGELPPNLCREVADLLDVTDVTLTLVGGAARRFTLCASSDNALTLDQWQFTLDEGPCLEAAEAGRTSSASTTATDDPPWPQLAEKAAELGYGTIGGTPLAVSGRPYGAMNIQNSGRLRDGLMGDAREIAGVLSTPIMSQLAEKAPALIDLADYATVHQASGMLSVQLGISVSDALAVLRARAWTEGRLLVTVATEIVNRQVYLGESDEEPQ